MMAIDVKRLSEADWIDLSRCEAKADKVLAERRMDRELLSAASTHTEGERRWFALRVQRHSEIDLCQTLIDSDIDAIVPVKKIQVARRAGSRGGKVVHRPVHRGLVFVCIVPSNIAFSGLLRVRGVAALVGHSDTPYPIGNHEMNVFMELAQAGAFDERNTPTGLVVGSRVRINVGPYAEMEGILEGYAPGRPARVLTYLFGGKMVVDVTLAHLVKLE